MAAPVPGSVVVTRGSELELLLARHGTREQARFFLERRGQAIADVERRHAPARGRARRRSRRPFRSSGGACAIGRGDLARFLFEPEDLVVAVGQDGLVANAAKYLGASSSSGSTPTRAARRRPRPSPGREDCGRTPPRGGRRSSACRFEERSDGRKRASTTARRCGRSTRCSSGHRSHQSARYRIGAPARARSASPPRAWSSPPEPGRHGLGALRERRAAPAPRAPGPFRAVRWPSSCASHSRASRPERALDGARLLAGGAGLEVVSEMDDGGVLFADGIEEDRLEFPFGARARFDVAPDRLRLVRGA